ncbi:uncharacterized protein LOC131945147 [Physella acuta]|uniref:uncharacterized protein LOC131945147 n=1 Tax=Physella acuta TaxID=109671 RepID=UPI0027DAED2E|nr:uncharacterized protein LOC131945147 [Physella acuta]
MGDTGEKKRNLQLTGRTYSQDKTQSLEETKSEGGFQAGHHETEICYGGEADLHKHCAECHKNPGHVNFIPVNDFNLDHLPSRYRDVIMLELIKILSALTVLIKVKYTSLKRPKSVPCFSGQYPFYNTRGSDVLRTGTGRVWHVVKYTESDNKVTCPCDKCQHSDTPSKVWGEVCVVTATHVVFDDSEARQTKCVVGFDDIKRYGVSLDILGVGEADIEGDVCRFTCVSCDLELLDELDKMCRHFDDLCEKVEDKYKRFDDVDKLTVIVSHPHGCPKQVSVEEWTPIQLYKYHHDCQSCINASILWLDFETVSCFKIESTNSLINNNDNGDTEEILKHMRTSKISLLFAIIASTVSIGIFLFAQSVTELNWITNLNDGVLTMAYVNSNALIDKDARPGMYPPVTAHLRLYPSVRYPDIDNQEDPIFSSTSHTTLTINQENKEGRSQYARGVSLLHDRIQILRQGLYYIYSNVNFQPNSTRYSSDFVYQTWFQYVHLVSPSSPAKSGVLLRTVHTCCSNCTNSQETSYTGGSLLGYLRHTYKVFSWKESCLRRKELIKLIT